LNPAFPAELDTCLMNALVKDPARRYTRAGDLARDLRRAAQGGSPPADFRTAATVKMPTPPRAQPPARSRMPLWPYLAFGGAAVVGLILFAALRERAPRQPLAPPPAPPVIRAAENEAAGARTAAEESDRSAAAQKKIEEEKSRLAREQASLEADRKKAARETARQKAVEEEARRPKPGTIQRRGVDNAEMVYIPAGTFTMGDTHEDGQRNEKPAHRVSLRAFWLDHTDVTNAQFAQFVRAMSLHPRAAWLNEAQGKDEHPAVHVTWDNAVAYCLWAGKRLPTEAEWEYAARGTDGRSYPWGETWDPSRARFRGNTGGQTTAPAGSYATSASPFGVLDLAGNVWQWTSSLEKPYPYVATDGREDPSAPGKRIVRGGAWQSRPEDLRTSSRWGMDPTVEEAFIGFRCAQN
jgi:formylglycine-generating enzyme required for sulfatase activity